MPEGKAQGEQIPACIYICPGCWTSPLGDTTACLGLEEPEVRWTHGRSRWPLFCLKKWGVNLLLSSTSNAEQWTVWSYEYGFLGVVRASCSSPTTRLSLAQVPFRLCFTSCKSLQRLSATAFPVPSYVPARRCGLYVLLFPVKPFSFLVSVWEMLWPVEIEQIFAFSPLCE